MTIDRRPTPPPEDMRSQLARLMESMGAPAPGDEWARDVVRCIVKWQQWRDHLVKTAVTALVGLSVVAAASWLGMALMKWSGAGW